jgi:3-isopropylmalate/(R)-2-methylmalate dehydratase small subunit
LSKGPSRRHHGRRLELRLRLFPGTRAGRHRASGISCVIAKTFARIFYRNAINIGLAILECEAASDGIDDGDEVSIDFDTGIITNITKGETYQAEPFPDFIKDMIQKGGLMASLKG